MPKIGLISDTHGYLDGKIFNYFADCDEIWHAGDFGTVQLSEELAKFKPLRGVYGNIDGQDVRSIHPLHNRFSIDGLEIWMTHIGGYPGNYDRNVKKTIYSERPDIFISGHSHILKVMKDPKIPNLIHINPGAAGKHGFHKIKTIITFEIQDRKISNMKAIELGKRA